LIEIYVPDTKLQNFSETKTAPIQKAEDFRHDEVPQRGTSRRDKLIHGLKELSNLLMSENSWYETRWISRSQRCIGHISRIPETEKILGELANDCDPRLLSPRTFVSSLRKPFLCHGSGKLGRS
jgi:hypothetical protein